MLHDASSMESLKGSPEKDSFRKSAASFSIGPCATSGVLLSDVLQLACAFLCFSRPKPPMPAKLQRKMTSLPSNFDNHGKHGVQKLLQKTASKAATFQQRNSKFLSALGDLPVQLQVKPRCDRECLSLCKQQLPSH